MSKRSKNFDLVLLGGAAALYFLFNNIFGNLFYAWLKQEFEKYTGVLESDVLAKLSQVSFSLLLVVAIIWGLYRYIHRELRAEFQAERDEQRHRLWELREEGVQLRNEGIATSAMAAWEDKFKKWHAAILSQAALVSMDLRHSLDPLDKLPMETTKYPDPKHQMNVSIVSEILVRIKNYLDKTQ
jgi:hypothetical protein